MTTVFLRSRSAQPADETTPQAQTLADIRRCMLDRPPVLQAEPLQIDPRTFDEAEKEMMALLEKRGFMHRDGRNNVVLIQRADIPERNFLLFGIPVVCQEAQ